MEVMSIDGMQFCWVPAGDFLMGDDASKTRLDYGYWLARYPVTAAQFRVYVDETNIELSKEYFNVVPANHPMVWVSWHEAIKFCDWLSERWQAKGWLPDGWMVSLPSEAEWEKAARGGQEIPATTLVQPPPFGLMSPTLHENKKPARAYPWGNDEDPERMNFSETEIWRTSTVGCFPGGASPYGAEELSGNVWEWTRSLKKGYPYDSTDGREDLKAQGSRVLRGGAFSSSAGYARCACRGDSDPDDRYYGLGFRVVVSPFFSER